MSVSSETISERNPMEQRYRDHLNKAAWVLEEQLRCGN